MKLFNCCICVVLVLCLLTACGEIALPVLRPDGTSAPVTVPTSQPTQAPTTEAPPSMLVEGVSVEDAICYFSEVCLDAEIIHEGDPSLLQKWTEPIQYTIFGSPTEEDLQILSAFFDWLNTVEGFPGIAEAAEEPHADLRIHFVEQAQIPVIMGDGFQNTDGAVTFWYNDNNAIYDSVVCIRTDVDQSLRNSVILEELYNGLGAVQDTTLRPDSIIYQDFSSPQWLSPVDELILRLLYHPDLQCGMTQAQCAECIRLLYR